MLWMFEIVLLHSLSSRVSLFTMFTILSAAHEVLVPSQLNAAVDSQLCLHDKKLMCEMRPVRLVIKNSSIISRQQFHLPAIVSVPQECMAVLTHTPQLRRW